MSVMERLLYTYFRSSAAYRVRIAMNLKGLPYQSIPVHLVREGGQQHAAAFRKLNPQELVPVLVEDGHAMRQSLAIIEWLEERHPTPSLLPGDAETRCRIRQIACTIACDVHPLQNLRVVQYLTGVLGASEDAKTEWMRHWMTLGFDALETELAVAPWRGRFCVGDVPTLADCCLVPQLFNARRIGINVERDYPVLAGVDAACGEIPAFMEAHPARQVDAE